jgi:zinc and cadmium transporter
MSNLIYILLSTIILSLISFTGVLTLAIKQKLLEKILLSLVALSAGVLIGSAFLHLIPEAIGISNVFLLVILGFIIFFIIEKFLHWQHCHEGRCEVHTFAHMSLVGGAIHNFIDGLIIASSFIISLPLGITTSIAIALHEIPQEIGNFGVLIYGGFKTKKALIVNFLVTLTKVIGGIVGFFLAQSVNLDFIPAIAAGGFLYIAASDLIPELLA